MKLIYYWEKKYYCRDTDKHTDTIDLVYKVKPVGAKNWFDSNIEEFKKAQLKGKRVAKVPTRLNNIAV